MIHKKTTYYNEDFEFTFEPIEETIDIKETPAGYEVKYLTHDEYPDKPDSWGDDDLFLVNYHRDFWIESKIISEDETRDFYLGEKIPQEKDYFIFKLACLVHSGVWLSLETNFQCDPGGWDTSHIGIVLASKKEFKTKNKAMSAAQSLIKVWNECLIGDVYCLVGEKYDKEKTPIDYDIVGGYYGFEYAKESLSTDI